MRFRRRDEGDRWLGGSPTTRETLEGVDARLRPDDLEEPRDDVDLDVELPELADRLEQLVVRRVGERDDHALDVEQRDDLGQAVGRSDECQVLELGTARPRMRVDEADEIDAVLGVLEELPRSQLADVAGADDDRVLEVERTAPRARARKSTHRGDEDDRQEPERDQPRHVRLATPAHHVPMKKNQAPSVTRWKTPTTSSIVEWSTCSSSRSYRP